MIRRVFGATALLGVVAALSARSWSQQISQQSPDKTAAQSVEKSTQQKSAEENSKAKPVPKLPAQIELLETHARFETNGDSRKEVHARVHINDELGARQFARLNFNYNRAFQSVEIPLAHITHAHGGTSDILSSAITDNPDPAVVSFPAYQDVRVKSIRILGLAPDDVFEYRVVTTTTHHPLAPDFWFEHSFDRSGVTAREDFELELPSSHKQDVHVSSATPADLITGSEEGAASRTTYKWSRTRPTSPGASQTPESDTEPSAPDVIVATEGWEPLSIRLDERLSFAGQTLESFGHYEDHDLPSPLRTATREVTAKSWDLTTGRESNEAKLSAIYDFVSQKIKTVDIALGSTGFTARPAEEILSSGYATQEDKFVLFAALASAQKLSANAALTGFCDDRAPARPTVFQRLLIAASDGTKRYWLDPSLEVAPFGVIPPNSGKCAFVLNRRFYVLNSTGHEWQALEAPLPFRARQRVTIQATLSAEGTLTTQAKYVVRGENELLLRVAFHQSPRDKWDGVAQLLAVSDGFRGKISKTTASDPYDTHDPFSVSYEIAQQKFLDWSKKPVRMPALLPLLGLPDPAESSAPKRAPIELGTPLDVEVSATVRLPDGTGAEVPAGTSLQRDFATYESHYAVSNGTLTASRHINFILKEIPAERAAEYNAFLHAVQNDESQLFALQPPEGLTTKPASTEQKQPPAIPKQ